MTKKQKVIAIVGASSTGKSELAIYLATQLNTEIISVDSRQIYKEMDIGTAKPDDKKNIIHHLMDFCDLSQEYTVANFSDDAKKILWKLKEEKKIPVLAGGTGLYFRVLLQDFDLPRVEPNLEMRKQLEEKTSEELHSMLSQIDSEASSKIHPNNKVKIIRALEVSISLNSKMSVEQKKKENEFDVLWLGLDSKDRNFLYRNCEKRVDTMMQSGLLNEALHLFEKYPNNKILPSTIGYKEFIPYLRKESTLDECVCKLKQNTRNYIKRQLSWFRANKEINRFYIDIQDRNEIHEKAMKLVKEFIS